MRRRKIVGYIAVALLGVSCSATHETSESGVAVSAAAITATSTVTVPAWTVVTTLSSWGKLGVLAQAITGLQGVALGANSGAGTVVECSPANKRRAVIAAGGPITAQPDAKVVDIVATGAVDLRDRVGVVGNVSSPSITLGKNVTISGKQITPGVPAAGDRLTWTVSTPGGTVSGWDLQPNQTQPIAPGRYGAMIVKSGAKLILTAPGRYFLESLDLEPGSTLQLPSGDQGTEIYVHGQSLILRGTIAGPANIEERLAIIYTGTSDVVVEAPLRGALVATSANVILRSVSSPHKGSVWGKKVDLDAGAKLQPVAQTFLITLGNLPADKCAWSIPPKSTGAANKRKDEFEYQYELLKYCISPGLPDDVLRLTGQINYESGEIGALTYQCAIQPGQFLGFLRSRMALLAAARADATLAHQMVVGPDSDGDWVPDSKDSCASTPQWTPVDATGCPIPIPPGPSCAAVRSHLDNSGVVMNPSCTEAATKMPEISLAVGVYWVQAPEQGMYLYVSDQTNGVPGCQPWYELEVRATKAGEVVDSFTVAFPYSAASHTGSIVPTIPAPYIELRAAPDAPGNVGRLGKLAQAMSTGNVERVYYRVHAISGGANRGVWSGWNDYTPQDCHAVGFHCIY